MEECEKKIKNYFFSPSEVHEWCFILGWEGTIFESLKSFPVPANADYFIPNIDIVVDLSFSMNAYTYKLNNLVWLKVIWLGRFSQ